MSPDLSARCKAFAENAVSPSPAKVSALPFTIPGGSEALAVIVRGLEAAGVALDKIIAWIPEIAFTLLTTTQEVKAVLDDILSRIKPAG